MKSSMTDIFTAACVQNCASIDAKETTDRAEYLIREAAAKGADLICTPEFFSCLDTVSYTHLTLPTN